MSLKRKSLAGAGFSHLVDIFKVETTSGMSHLYIYIYYGGLTTWEVGLWVSNNVRKVRKKVIFGYCDTFWQFSKIWTLFEHNSYIIYSC